MPAHWKRRTPGGLDISAVKEAFDAFSTEERGLSAASKVSYWFVVRRFLAGCQADQMRVDPAALGPTQVTAFLVRRAADNADPDRADEHSGGGHHVFFIFG